MSQNHFVSAILRLFPASTINFRFDEGKSIAEIDQEITVVCNRVSHRATVNWGSGHTAMVNLEA